MGYINDKYYLAIDIGASSGRHIIGYMDNNELITDEVYRFSNQNQELDGHLTWDIDYLFQEVKKGITQALIKYPHIESLSIDTWAVDYVLLDNNNQEIYPCFAYRDNRTLKYIDEVHKIIPFEELYQITGCQYQPFNTIYQLYTDLKENRLDKCRNFLMIPEYLMYKLTGVMKKEYTNAGSMGLFDLKTNKVSTYILNKLGIKEELFTNYAYPGDEVGNLTQEVQEEVGGNIKVVLCATHDTASACEGISIGLNIPYISSGTWSLLGVKTKTPCNSIEAFKANYSNEFGPNYFRFQKNIMGLWILQCLKKEIGLDFVEMMNIAKVENNYYLIDVNKQRFLSPTSMKDEIISEIKEQYDIYISNISEVISSVYHSLAESYKQTIIELETILNQKYQEIYIVGGGAKNTYLNELTEMYTGKKVIALPIEATAIGNLLAQIHK